MPSCQSRTATPVETLMLVWGKAKDKEGGATKARPEQDFVNHCGCDSGWLVYMELGDIRKVKIRGGNSLNGFQCCLNRRGL